MQLSIVEIQVGEDRRKLNSQAVEKLAESIAALGLLHPIVVDKNYRLVAGLHRLEAMKLLGHSEIKCNVIDFKGLQAQLAEIDENFVRTPLSEIEKCNTLLRRKKIYEELHPEAAHGGDRKSKKIKSAQSGLDFEHPKSFVQDTAEKLDMCESAIEKRVRIAERVTQDAKAVFEDAKDKYRQKEALKLTHIPPEHQEEAARQYVAGEIRTISDYKPPETPQTEPNHQDRDGNHPEAANKPAKPKGAKKQTAKGKAAANPDDAEKPDVASPPAMTVSKPPPASPAQKGASGQAAGGHGQTADSHNADSHNADGQEAKRQEAQTPTPKDKPKQENPPCAPQPDAPSVSALPDQSVDAAAKEKAKKALAASYKDPIIGRIVADMKDADMERPLTTEIFVGDFESAINALIKRIKWFDIQEYQDIFAEVTEEQFQQLREIEKRAYSCLDNFMNTVKEKMNA